MNLKDKIVDLSYLSLEQLGDLVTDREAIFDVYCKTSDDAYIIVEMQNAAQNYFRTEAYFIVLLQQEIRLQKVFWIIN